MDRLEPEILVVEPTAEGDEFFGARAAASKR